MKRYSCFYVANFGSVILFFLIGYALRHKAELLGLTNRESITVAMLQILFLIKYTALLLALLPARINLNQIALGFICADLTMAILNSVSNSFSLVPLNLIIFQGTMLLAFLWFYQAFSVSAHNIKNLFPKRRLITGGI